MHLITTTIKREWFREIVAKRKRVESRDLKPYWSHRLDALKTPFLLRLINGMQPNAPEVTIVVDRVRRNARTEKYELHLGRIREVKNWDRKTEEPSRQAMCTVSRSTVAQKTEAGASPELQQLEAPGSAAENGF